MEHEGLLSAGSEEEHHAGLAEYRREPDNAETRVDRLRAPTNKANWDSFKANTHTVGMTAPLVTAVPEPVSWCFFHLVLVSVCTQTHFKQLQPYNV